MDLCEEVSEQKQAAGSAERVRVKCCLEMAETCAKYFITINIEMTGLRGQDCEM